MTMALTRVRFLVLAAVLVFAGAVSLSAAAPPAHAADYYCGSGINSVIHSDYNGYNVVSTGCSGPTLIRGGDNVLYPASAGAWVRIDPREHCDFNVDGRSGFGVSNPQYYGSRFASMPTNTTVRIYYCYNY